MNFKPVDPRTNFVKQEEELLKFWDRQKIFQKSLELRKDAKRYVFFEGPPSANAKPGVHHVLARAFKDLWPRYKTMQGFLVERKAGWDTHGLPIEVGVEKELGLKDKRDVEKYGVAKFNAKCKESVWRYKEDWEKLTERMAFWLDMSDPYITYDPKYIESLWWIIKQIWDKGLLYEGYKVVPRCTRCGTALSSHEVAQGYREVEEDSIYVKFKVKNQGSSSVPRSANKNTYLLAWTTTPWTLPGNVALAVGKDMDYVKAKVSVGRDKNNQPIYENLILAKSVYEDAQDNKHPLYEILNYEYADYRPEGAPSIEGDCGVPKEMKGKDLLVGIEYEPLFDGAIPKTAENYKNAFKVYPADFVTTEEGTGVVHTAVMYGDEDYQLGEQVGLPKVHTVSEDGLFLPSVKKWAGKYVKDPKVEKEIVEDLKRRGLLLKETPYKHDYPFCWRCETPLLYYAAHSWFIRMSELRDQLIKNNRTINWIPDHIKEGRFGEWLREVKDWAVSRERYWGTPLPIWKSEDGDMLCVGSFDELKRLARDPDKIALAPRSSKSEGWDPHKPFIDEIVLEKGGKEYRRVPEVCDTWFDSGSMPFAQWHYPFENQDRVDGGKSFPAEFIAEAVDQTRGWFYTLLAVSTLLDRGTCYKYVISLGHVLDKHGKKMSKSKGNVVDPWKMFNEYGSDALRWYLYSTNQAGLSINFDEANVKQAVRTVMLTLWNTYSFFVTYANIDKFNADKTGKLSPKNSLDKWILTRKNQLIGNMSESLDKYDVMRSCWAIELFVNDLSNWYVRRSRRRFWKGDNDTDKQQAYFTLYTVLKDAAKLLAPFMPFLSESIYQNLKIKEDPESVHLADWPVAEKVDGKVLKQMFELRGAVESGLHQRKKAGIKVRRPLARFETTLKDLPNDLVEVMKDELNVKEIKLGAKGNKLDTKITPELKVEGTARELVRSIQVLRKDKGFAIEDRIKVTWASSDKEIRGAFKQHFDYIKTEVLATELTEKENQGEEVKVNGSVVKLLLEK